MNGSYLNNAFIMIAQQIRSVKLQLDSMAEVAKENAMSSVFQNEITEEMFMTYQGFYYHLEI